MHVLSNNSSSGSHPHCNIGGPSTVGLPNNNRSMYGGPSNTTTTSSKDNGTYTVKYEDSHSSRHSSSKVPESSTTSSSNACSSDYRKETAALFHAPVPAVPLPEALDDDEEEEEAIPLRLCKAAAAEGEEAELLTTSSSNAVSAAVDRNGGVGLLLVHNVMACSQLNCDIDLDAACRALGNAVYMPEEFHSVRVDVRCRTGCVASINVFSNGKMTGTGANNVEEIHRAMRKVAKRLQLHPLTRCSVSFTHFQVKNILGSFSLKSALSLHALAAQRALGVDYEPERFPGAKIRISVPRTCLSNAQNKGESEGSGAVAGAWASQSAAAAVGDGQQRQHFCDAMKEEVVTLQIFSTGNIILFGARKVESLEYALQSILPYLKKCLVQDVDEY